MTALASTPSLRRTGMDERSLENFYGGMRKSVSSNLKRIKAILSSPILKFICGERRVYLLLKKTSFLMKTPLGTFAIVKAHGIRQWQGERENKFKICFGG